MAILFPPNLLPPHIPRLPRPPRPPSPNAPVSDTDTENTQETLDSPDPEDEDPQTHNPQHPQLFQMFQMFRSDPDLRHALQLVASIAHVHAPAGHYDPTVFYYHEQDDEFQNLRCFQLYFHDDPFWHHSYDRPLFTKCWIVANTPACLELVMGDSDPRLFHYMDFLPVPMRLFVLKQMVDFDNSSGGHNLWVAMTQPPNRLLYDYREGFREHVLTHLLYLQYRMFYSNYISGFQLNL